MANDPETSDEQPPVDEDEAGSEAAYVQTTPPDPEQPTPEDFDLSATFVDQAQLEAVAEQHRTIASKLAAVRKAYPDLTALASMQAEAQIGRSLKTLIDQSSIGKMIETASQRAGLIDPARFAPNLGVAGALAERGRTLDWARQIGGGSIAEWARLHEQSGIAELARQANWTSRIDLATAAGIGKLIGGGVTVQAELARMQGLGTTLAAMQSLADRTSSVAAIAKQYESMSATALKLSAFAGGLDLVGARSATTSAAFQSLLGGWRTHADLPASFWRDRERRLRAYRDVEVDPGLVEADNPALIEVLIDSGVVERADSRGPVTAIVRAGPLDVRVSASRPRLGAYRAITGFEVALRAFVAAKLEEAVVAAGERPQGWFKRRMPGDVLKRVRERREAARLDGEAPAPEISFVDLGDFIAIAEQKHNRDVFEAAFGSVDAFKVDLMRLNAIRRPAAHPRPIDPVQLAETVLTIGRLTAAMQRDGAWDPAWETDDG